MKIFASLLAIACVSGCGEQSYLALNTATLPSDNYIVIDKPLEAVWDESVPELGKQFFVIDNLDKSSGLINLSYSGDPEKFIDCGNIKSEVKNTQGEHTYDFPAAKAQAAYEITKGNVLFHIDRKMSLNAHVKLVFKEINPNQTQITANTLYVVQKDVTARRADINFSQSWSDSISFTTRGASPIGNDVNSAATSSCVPTRKLEREILSAIK